MIEFRRESKFRNETDPQIELLDKSDEKSKFSNPQIDRSVELNVPSVFIPGQRSSLHGEVSSAAPNPCAVQFCPPYEGEGFVQFLSRFCIPPPQVLLHKFHSDHSV